MHGPGSEHGSGVAVLWNAWKTICAAHARVMIHQPLGGFQGQAADIEIQAKEILKMRERVGPYPGQTYISGFKKGPRRHGSRFFMSSEEAKAYGLIDQVVTYRPKKDDQRDKKTKKGIACWLFYFM